MATRVVTPRRRKEWWRLSQFISGDVPHTDQDPYVKGVDLLSGKLTDNAGCTILRVILQMQVKWDTPSSANQMGGLVGLTICRQEMIDGDPAGLPGPLNDGNACDWIFWRALYVEPAGESETYTDPGGTGEFVLASYAFDTAAKRKVTAPGQSLALCMTAFASNVQASGFGDVLIASSVLVALP